MTSAMPTELTPAQIRFLRGRAHALKALLQVGNNGVTDALAAEVDLALERHELIKIKVGGEDRRNRDAMIADLLTRADASLVQRIGHIAVLYRPGRDDRRRIALPRD